MEKVLVLMSTYNGEKYLCQQLDTIFSQKGVDVFLHVRDDGSEDGTLRILENYKNRHTERMVVDKCGNIGVKSSFLELISKGDKHFGYYALADQDDIWEPDKLASALEMLKPHEDGKPLIYGSSVYVFADNRIDGICFRQQGPFRFGNFLVKNYYPGCTMVFNNPLKRLIEEYDYKRLSLRPLHDHWMNLVCTGCGGRIVYDQQPHMLYRQHSGNVVGAYRSIFLRLKNNGLFSNEKQRYQTAMELLLSYGDCLSEDARNLLKEIQEYDGSWEKRLCLAANKNVRPKQMAEKALIVLNILLGKF